MKRILCALASTFLIVEIAAIVTATLIWAVLSELHFGNSIILGTEAIASLGIIALAIAVFRKALRAETQMVEVHIDE